MVVQERRTRLGILLEWQRLIRLAKLKIGCYIFLLCFSRIQQAKNYKKKDMCFILSSNSRLHAKLLGSGFQNAGNTERKYLWHMPTHLINTTFTFIPVSELSREQVNVWGRTVGSYTNLTGTISVSVPGCCCCQPPARFSSSFLPKEAGVASKTGGHGLQKPDVSSPIRSTKKCKKEKKNLKKKREGQETGAWCSVFSDSMAAQVFTLELLPRTGGYCTKGSGPRLSSILPQPSSQK